MGKKLALRLAAIPAFVAATAGAAHAALPAAFEAAVTTYQGDMTEGFGLLIAAGIVVWGLRKLGQKLGLL